MNSSSSRSMRRRSSARTARHSHATDLPTASSSAPSLAASNAPPLVSKRPLEVTFCAVQRVRNRAFLLLCTRFHWRLYRLDGLSAGRESCTPVELLVDPRTDAQKLSDVRLFRLYALPTAADALGALFVLEKRSGDSNLSEEEEEEDAFVLGTGLREEDDGREELVVLALDEQRVLHRLSRTPSLVVDVQTNAATAAVLCETCELFLYDLATFQLQQVIRTASPAMALGPRWLAYPGFVLSTEVNPGAGRQQTVADVGDSDSDFDDVPIEAMGIGRVAAAETRDASAYTAIDVAQNVASGLYYLSEVGRATIAPYLSSSPGISSDAMHDHRAEKSPSRRRHSGESRKASCNGTAGSSRCTLQVGDEAAALSTKKRPGWVVVLDLVTNRVMANFSCHSTALVNLSLDSSGLLLATSSNKGQNLHVYRLSPPLQSIGNKPGAAGDGHGTLQYQLVYKLQRGITHASIEDIAFSQDGKWINVTSAHGTSHLYALHPEGARISADTHANTIGSADESNADALNTGFCRREVSDFYADFRTLETRTQTQVLRIRHELRIPDVSTVLPHKSVASACSKSRPSRSSRSSSSSSMSSTSSSSSPPGFASNTSPVTIRSSTLMESALDASQALLSHLATSAIDFGHQHFENDMGVSSRRRRLRQRLCSLFAPDGHKILIYCDPVLKLYDMRVTALSQHKADRARATPLDSKTKNSKSSLSSFGFEASVTELKSWELFTSGRRKTEPLSSVASGQSRVIGSSASGDARARSELRTFAQRSLPLWAHPKVTFRAIDEGHPEGQILEVKRKGPNPSQDLNASTMSMTLEGYANGDEQLFVMEMDSYFGIGGSPVFDGRSEHRPATPEIPPPLNLSTSIDMAMSSSLSETPPKVVPEVKNTICFRPIDQYLVSGASSTRKREKKKGKNRRILTPPSCSEAEAAVVEDGCTTGGLASLQFTLQDTYFALPTDEGSD
uniref:BCAS3 WD40 domain-containing protein n=1 Tax=Peronospora matthiolae TaxID=2874970 RepID=A0AAV1VDL0_9STRA